MYFWWTGAWQWVERKIYLVEVKGRNYLRQFEVLGLNTNLLECKTRNRISPPIKTLTSQGWWLQKTNKQKNTNLWVKEGDRWSGETKKFLKSLRKRHCSLFLRLFLLRDMDALATSNIQNYMIRSWSSSIESAAGCMEHVCGFFNSRHNYVKDLSWKGKGCSQIWKETNRLQ